MTMAIENYEGTLDTFTLPNNPTAFDDAIVSVRASEIGLFVDISLTTKTHLDPYDISYLS